MSHGALARAMGRKREEVYGWISGRKHIPRHCLIEMAIQLGHDTDLPYVLHLRSCEDAAGQLRRQVRTYARRLGCGSQQIERAIHRLARSRLAEERTVDQAGRANTMLRYLADARFVFRLLTEAATTGNYDAVISRHNIHRHLRYPVNHFLGLALDLGDLPTGKSRQSRTREETLRRLRALATLRPAVEADDLVRHHAIHMLGRHGDDADRDTVEQITLMQRRSSQPVAVLLGYMGLIMYEEDPMVVDRYVTLLRQDDALARADLSFEAVHYGDVMVELGTGLPGQVHQFERTLSNILRRLERPERYGFLSELDSLRVLNIMHQVGPAPFRCGGAALRLRRVCESSNPPPVGSVRWELEHRVCDIADGRTANARPQATGSGVDLDDSPNTVGPDVFIGYNSRDLAQVLVIVEALQARGVKPWIDKLDLPPGRMFQGEIDRVLRTCRAVVLVVGADGIGPWQTLEMRAAIGQCVDREIPVIPVILNDDAYEPLPAFLRELRMIRLRSGGNVYQCIDELIWGITGSKPPRAAFASRAAYRATTVHPQGPP